MEWNGGGSNNERTDIYMIIPKEVLENVDKKSIKKHIDNRIELLEWLRLKKIKNEEWDILADIEKTLAELKAFKDDNYEL